MSLNVPLNNDEAVHFQPIACKAFPNAQLHRFREACGVKDLNIFGFRLPLRSYHYAGVSGSLAFIPFWWLIAAPIALRVSTGVLWLANSIVLSRLLMLPWALVMGVVMLSTPIFAQHLIDTGPVAWQLLVLECGVWLAVRGFMSSSLLGMFFFSGLAGLCAFLAFEQKGFVVNGAFLVLYLFIVAAFRRGMFRGDGAKIVVTKILTNGITFGLVAGGLLWVLLTATTMEGNSYYTALQNATRNYSFSELEVWTGHFMVFVRDFILFPAKYFHRVYDVSDIVSRDQELVAAAWLFRIIAGVALLLAVERKWAHLGLLALALLMAGGNLFLIARAQMAWAGHHVIFAHILLFIGLAVALGALLPRRSLLVVPAVVFLLYLQIKPWRTLVHATPKVESDPSRMELIAIVDQPDFASKHIVTHLSWGTYFIDALFGPKDQLVNWVDTPEQPELESLAVSQKRQLAFLRFECSKSDPRSQMVWDQYAQRKNLTLQATSSSGKWQLWVEPPQ
jgi:hypothetical protein